MPHGTGGGAVRDPETGRFVAQGDGRDFGYSDLDAQHIVFQVDTDNNLSDSLETVDPAISFDPLGGLARQELAELVMLKVDSVLQPSATDGADSGRFRAWGEVSFDSDERTLVNEAADVTDAGDYSDITGIQTREVDVVDIDVLDAWAIYVNSPEYDTVNGVGMSASSVPYHNRTAYRALLGAGPMVDRHDELHLHLAHSIEGEADFVDLRWDTRLTLLWDVFEKE